MPFDVLIRALFSDQGLSVGLAKANAGLSQLGRSGPGARAGLKAVETGARMLAFEAAGLTGGIGQVARGLLSFGGGSALILGAAAGLGIVGFAYKALTKDARDAKKEQDEFVKSLGTIGPHAKALQQRIRLQEVQAALAKAERGTFIGFQGEEEIRDIDVLEVEKLRREESAAINALRAAEREDAEATAKAGERIANAAERQNKALAEMMAMRQAGLRAFLRGEIPTLGLAETQALRPLTPERRRAAEVEAGAFIPELRGGELGRLQRGAREGEERAARARGEITAPPAGIDRAALIASVAGLIGSTKTGGLPGFVTGAGGVMAQIPGLQGPGAVVASLGAVFQLFDKSEDKRHKELISAIERLGQDVGLDRVTVVFTGPGGQEIRRSLAELEESDAVERVPGPVGARG